MNRLTFNLLLLLLVAAWSCEKEGDVSLSHPQPAPSAASVASSTGTQQETFSQLNKDFALQVINFNYANVFNPLKIRQIQGVSRQQFKQWLRNSKITLAEQNYLEKYLGPLLAHPEAEFIKIYEVTLRKTGNKVTAGLIAVPPDFFCKYTRAVTVVVPTDKDNTPKKLCFSRTFGPHTCINYIRFIPTASSCPSDTPICICGSSTKSTSGLSESSTDSSYPGNTIGRSIGDAISSF